MSARSELVRALKEGLPPRRYQVIDHEVSLGTIAKPTVILKQSTLSMLPQAPMGKLLVSFTVTVASPSTDARRREIELDDDVLALCVALDAHPDVMWTEARKVAVTESVLGYDIDTQIAIDKE